MKFDEARACVIERVTAARVSAPPEQVALDSAAGRVLAENILADRDFPALARSVRDGFAVRAADLPGTCASSARCAPAKVSRAMWAPGEAVEIMTGAPVPRGADRGGHGGTRHASARWLRHYGPRRRTRPVHQSARVRSARRRSSAHARQAAGLRRHRPAGGGRQERGCRVSPGRAWRFSPPATRSCQ